MIAKTWRENYIVHDNRYINIGEQHQSNRHPICKTYRHRRREQ